LEAVTQACSVILDLRQVQDLPDSALSLLIPILRDLRTRVLIRGLRRHQRLILRYLGVPSSAIEAVEE
jgi:hypothetical protein